jgi:hypothetical protein
MMTRKQHVDYWLRGAILPKRNILDAIELIYHRVKEDQDC